MQADRTSPGSNPGDPTKATFRELPILGRALSLPARLVRGRRSRRIQVAIDQLARAYRRYHAHVVVAVEAVPKRATSTPRLSTFWVVAFDLMVLAFDATFYIGVMAVLLDAVDWSAYLATIPWALPVPVITIVGARILGPQFRTRTDAEKPALTRLGYIMAVVLLVTITALLAVFSINRFTVLAANAELSPFTAVLFGLIFAVIPVCAILVHALHDPGHRSTLLRHARTEVKLAAAYTSARLKLLAHAQKIMIETVDAQRVVDLDLAATRADEATMGVHPVVRHGEDPALPMAEKLAAVWAEVGQPPVPLVDLVLRYNWTAFYPILSALEAYPPPQPLEPAVASPPERAADPSSFEPAAEKSGATAPQFNELNNRQHRPTSMEAPE